VTILICQAIINLFVIFTLLALILSTYSLKNIEKTNDVIFFVYNN